MEKGVKNVQVQAALTDEERKAKKEAIIESIFDGCSKALAARGAGVPRRTLYNWLQEDDEFRLSVNAARMAAVNTMEEVAFVCGLKAEENPRYQTSMVFWLKAQAGWKETLSVQMDGDAEGLETRDDILRRIDSLATRLAAKGDHSAPTADGDEPV